MASLSVNSFTHHTLSRPVMALYLCIQELQGKKRQPILRKLTRPISNMNEKGMPTHHALTQVSGFLRKKVIGEKIVSLKTLWLERWRKKSWASIKWKDLSRHDILDNVRDWDTQPGVHPNQHDKNNTFNYKWNVLWTKTKNPR